MHTAVTCYALFTMQTTKEERPETCSTILYRTEGNAFSLMGKQITLYQTDFIAEEQNTESAFWTVYGIYGSFIQLDIIVHIILDFH
jgi:hypothetical protein